MEGINSSATGGWIHACSAVTRRTVAQITIQLHSICSELRTRALSKGESIEGDRLQTLEGAIERIRESTPGLERDGSRRLLRNALVFGVGELDESTRRLIDLRRGQDSN